MVVFPDIHVTLSILFPGDLLRKLGKFVTTLHSSNSSSDCFHTVLNIPCPSIITPSIGSLFMWVAIHFWPVFGNEPLSYFIISVVFPLCSIITHCIFSTFPSCHIGFVCLPETSQWYHDFLRWWDWTHQHMVIMSSLFSEQCQFI